jgi:hypothetical protein
MVHLSPLVALIIATQALYISGAVTLKRRGPYTLGSAKDGLDSDDCPNLISQVKKALLVDGKPLTKDMPGRRPIFAPTSAVNIAHAAYNNKESNLLDLPDPKVTEQCTAAATPPKTAPCTDKISYALFSLPKGCMDTPKPPPVVWKTGLEHKPYTLELRRRANECVYVKVHCVSPESLKLTADELVKKVEEEVVLSKPPSGGYGGGANGPRGFQLVIYAYPQVVNEAWRKKYPKAGAKLGKTDVCVKVTTGETQGSLMADFYETEECAESKGPACKAIKVTCMA